MLDSNTLFSLFSVISAISSATAAVMATYITYKTFKTNKHINEFDNLDRLFEKHENINEKILNLDAIEYLINLKSTDFEFKGEGIIHSRDNMEEISLISLDSLDICINIATKQKFTVINSFLVSIKEEAIDLNNIIMHINKGYEKNKIPDNDELDLIFENIDDLDELIKNMLLKILNDERENLKNLKQEYNNLIDRYSEVIYVN